MVDEDAPAPTAIPVDTYNNPAGRLYRLLQQGKQAGNQNRSAREVWGEVFGLDPSDTPGLFRRLSLAAELPDAVAAAVRNLPGEDPNLLLDWVPRAKQVLSHENLAASWNGIIQKIDDGDIRVLRICSQRLSGRLDQVDLEDDGLTRLREEIQSAVAEAQAATDVPAEVRDFVIQSLQRILLALDEYQFRGMAAFREAVERFLTSAAIQPEVSRRAAATTIGKRMLGFLAGLNLLLDVLGGGYQLVEEIVEDLSSPTVAFEVPHRRMPRPQLPGPTDTTET